MKNPFLAIASLMMGGMTAYPHTGTSRQLSDDDLIRKIERENKTAKVCSD